MIHFQQPPEPDEFDECCRRSGNQWLEEHPDDARPRDYWSKFKEPLAQGFSDLCAYSVMYVPNGAVDHFLSCKNYRHLSYESLLKSKPLCMVCGLLSTNFDFNPVVIF